MKRHEELVNKIADERHRIAELSAEIDNRRARIKSLEAELSQCSEPDAF